MSYGNLGGYVVRLKAAELAGLCLNISSGAPDSLYLNGGTSPGCHFLYSDIDGNYSESNGREKTGFRARQRSVKSLIHFQFIIGFAV